MSDETKLAIWKFTLKIFRKLLWHADEWLHAQELALRNELPATHPVPDVAVIAADPVDEIPEPEFVARSPRPRRKRQRVTANAFDLRYVR